MDFFKNLYQTTGATNFSPILEAIPCLFTVDMNQGLAAEVTMEEIKQAVFQLGSLSARGPDGFNGKFFQKH